MKLQKKISATMSLKPVMNKNIKDENLKRVRLFLRLLERNVNSYFNSDYNHDPNRKCKGFFMRIDSVNGIKKIWEMGAKPTDRRFYIRFFLTFYNQHTSQFIGNTFKSPLLKIKFNETGHYELNEPEPLYVYFLTPNYNADVPSGSGTFGRPSFDQCVVEVVFVETNQEDYVLSQSCEGWSILNITDNDSVNPKPVASNVYLGTSRQLLNKGSTKGEGNVPLSGASVLYSCANYKELEKIKFLVPNYVLLGYQDILPGLYMNYLSKKPIINEPIKFCDLYDVYLKNVEITISPNLESQLINTARTYRKQKLELEDDSSMNPVIIKERKLRCGVHNSYTFINSNGMENFVSLTQKENYLLYKGVHHIENYFHSEYCCFAFELNYTLSIPSNRNDSELINFIIGYVLLIPTDVDMENSFRSATMITGPGVTVYGEHLYEFINTDDRVIKINYILTKNKDNYDKTFKHKEMEEIQTRMQVAQKTLKEDYNKLLQNKNQDYDELIKRKENDLEEMEQKLRDSHRELTTMYGKDVKFDKLDNSFIKQVNQTTNKFIIDDNYQPDENALPFERDEVRRNTNKPKTYVNLSDDKVYTNSYYLKDDRLKNDNNVSFNDGNDGIINDEKSENRSVFMNKTNNRYEEREMHIGTDDNFNINNFRKTNYQQIEEDYKEYYPNYRQPRIIYDYNARDVSRKDKTELISKGLLAFDIKEKSDNLINFTLDKELKDDKKAHIFTIQFLAYKPNSDIKDYKTVPDKIFFKFNFWDFENFITTAAKVSKPNSSIAPSSMPLILQKENAFLSTNSDDKEMKVEISFDPSMEAFIDYKDFVEYLLNRQILIEVYDGEKLFYLGCCKVPLRDLLRQGKPNVYQTKEYEIFDDKMCSKASIQILLRSTGLSTHKTFLYDPSALKIINTKDKLNLVHRKKKVKAHAMDIERISLDEKEMIAKSIINQNESLRKVEDSKGNHNPYVLRLDPETEKRLRVMKYANNPNKTASLLQEDKMKQMHKIQEKENDFYKTLNYVNRIKEYKRKDILSHTMQDNNKNTLNVSLMLGQPFYSNFILYNNTEEEELYHIIITKSNESNENSENTVDQTVRIISNPDEWRTVTEDKKLVKPNDYQSITNNYLIIKPNESIPVLIKLLSYDEKCSNSEYTVWVYRKNGQPLYYLTITIVKVFPVIDHVFKYYMPENRYLAIKFPNPFKFDKNKTQKILENYYCSDINTAIQVDPETSDFSFKFKLLSEGYKSEFYLFLYLDACKSNLYATWKFEIFSMANVDIHGSLGAKITQKLQLESDRVPRTVQLYSNNPELLFFSDKFNTPFILVPNMHNEAKYIAFPKNNYNNDILVNCVDVSNRELLKTWMIRLIPEKPQINYHHQIDCKVGSYTNFKYEYLNQLNNYVILNFESNNPDILNIVDSRLPFNSNEKKLINITVPPQNMMGRAEVLVFVSDSEEMFSDTILFQLNYK